MLIHEWSPLVGVALHARLIAAHASSHLAKGVATMHVVAVAALHEPLANPVVKGLGKLGLGRRVTAEAEIGLLLDQQCLRLGGMVRGVAVKTTDIIRGMSGGRKPALFVFLSMTAQAASVLLGARQLLETNDLADIAAVLINQLRVREVGGDLRVRSAERLRDAVVKALGKIHAVLDSGQRAQLAYLIRTGVLSI